MIVLAGIRNAVYEAVAQLLRAQVETRSIVDDDVRRWNDVLKRTDSLGSLFRRPEFRSVLYYRLTKGGRRGIVAAHLSARILPGQQACFLHADLIGPGLYLQHGFSTIVVAESIGRDFWVAQQVTIGYVHDVKPTIGDGVKVFAGAKVVGGISLGDGAVVGANAVVLKSVPAGCHVAGVPARIIRRNGERVDESL